MPARASTAAPRPRLPALAAAIALATGCSTSGAEAEGQGGAAPLSAAELRDPASCQRCHPAHVAEWAGSMHAYAAEDPVFVAMNARGQRETGGALGTFCVKCHAPLAVRDGATKDGLNLASLPAWQRGVTCAFCHSIAEVKGTHDAALELAKDGVLRAGLADPMPTGAHRSAYSALHDREQEGSSSLCGSCHDIVTPNGTHLERTYAEWQSTVFAHPPGRLTCSQCHMEGRDSLAAEVPGAPTRRTHDHRFAGVDVALTDFPARDEQRAAVQRSLDSTLQAALCVKAGSLVEVVLDNVGAGHLFPSGASQDRRAWVELVAWSGGQRLFESGVVAEHASPLDAPDPDLWLFRDCLLDAKGHEVHMFWEATRYDSNQLPAPVTLDPQDPAFYSTHVKRAYPRTGELPSPPDRVTMRVRVQPIGGDVLRSLVTSGDLDAAVALRMPTFDLAGATLEWTPEKATLKYLEGGLPVTCVTRGLTTGANTAVPAPEHQLCAP
jgi:hypothetical protein